MLGDIWYFFVATIDVASWLGVNVYFGIYFTSTNYATNKPCLNVLISVIKYNKCNFVLMPSINETNK
jgi:hypothetical protein